MIQFLRVYLLISLLCFGYSTSFSQVVENFRPPVFLSGEHQWSDSVLSQLTLEEKIGQLFMVAAYSNGDAEHVSEIEQLIREYKIGGLIFMQGGPHRQAQLNNKFQNTSSVPLLIAMDAEWGLSMRLDSTVRFPRQMSLGAAADEQLAYDYGAYMAEEHKRMGVHVSFSPVVDVNNNADNPVIGSRAFGEEKELVSRLGSAYMRGLQDNGVLATAKHFPGHGDTDQDSHKTLPIISYTKERLDSIELAPFKRLIGEGLGGMMIAHLIVPALDTTESLASTLSIPIVTDLLRNELGFDGLIFTDALNMKGVSDFWESGELEVRALMAGNDVLLFPGDVPTAVDRILEAVELGVLTESQIDEHCLRVLQTKEWCGLDNPENALVSEQNLFADLNSPRALALKQRVIESSLTVLKNPAIIPFKTRQIPEIAVLQFGKNGEAFESAIQKFGKVKVFNLPKNPDFQTSQDIVDELSEYKTVIINLLQTSNSTSINYGITNQSIRIANAINTNTQVILNVFANPYSLKKLTGVDKMDGLVIAYHDDDMTQEIVAGLMFGANLAKGQLPVTVNGRFPASMGSPLLDRTRLFKSAPEFVGLNSADFTYIDTIALSGIREHAYPGCRVLVAHQGAIIWDKSYGYHTYEEKRPVDESSIYDLASITKIVASTAAIMKLEEQKMVDMDYSLCDYVNIPDTASHYQINLREMMSHYARLKSWIPFYLNTLEKGQLRKDLYRTQPIPGYCTQVAEGLYICDSYVDSMHTAILKSDLIKDQHYNYSDLGYYYLQQLVYNVTGRPLQEYVQDTFYSPLGLKTMGYLPLEKFELDQIVPTEFDMLFRGQLIHGHVHDPGAAMLGGVGGHAGIFSDAFDLAIMMQMFMNGGTYGGQRYLSEEVITEFTRAHYLDDDNRRGIGFDKPALIPNTGPTCPDASFSSFGHSGFTGTLAWADPEHDLVYVFLSNRVYPNADNRKLLSMNIRTDIQQVIYDALRNARLNQIPNPFFPDFKAER
jgi:beta-N-acetylhexosaminidase